MAECLLRCTERWLCWIPLIGGWSRTFLINKFRGDAGVLLPGLEELTRRTGVPFAGVLPWLPDVWLDAEDTLEVAAWRRHNTTEGTLRVAVVRLPRMSNGTDVEALAAEPGVEVLVTADPQTVRGADLVRASRVSIDR